MSLPVVLQALTLPANVCQLITDEQTRLNVYVAYMTANFPGGFGGVFVGANPPADTTLAWLRIDGGSGAPIGWYLHNGTWLPAIKPIPIFYADDTGAVNALITTYAFDASIPGGVTKEFSLVEGTTVFVKVKVTNTGITTMVMNGSLATPVRKRTPGGLVELSANDLIAGDIVILSYDGAQWLFTGAPTSNTVMITPTFVPGSGAPPYTFDTAEVNFVTYNAAAIAAVPTYARYVILEMQGSIGGAPATDPEFVIDFRQGAAGLTTFKGWYGKSTSGYFSASCAQFLCPVDVVGAAVNFDMKCDGIATPALYVLGVTVKIIGYIF